MDINLCNECRQPNTNYDWCQLCNARHFQENFKNWTSGNINIDEFIQNAQLKAKNYKEVLEWIEYDNFENLQYLAKGEFGTIYKANWKDGFIKGWNTENNQWNRWGKKKIVLKCLHDSQNITVELLREDESDLMKSYGITKDPETNNFMLVSNYNDCLCYECMNPMGHDTWSHKSCNAKRFQQHFQNWTSGNHDVDEFIQKVQLKAKNDREVLEWIEYDRFQNIAKEEVSGTTYKAIWKDGNIESWDSYDNQWKRQSKRKVALKCLHDSQNITEFLRKVESHLTTNNSDDAVQCYGITKDPKTNNFIMVMGCSNECEELKE